MSEKEALERLAHLGIPLRSLRDYCVQNNLAVNGAGHYSYKKDFIDELSENWVGRSEVMRKLKLDHMSFHRAPHPQEIDRGSILVKR